MRELCGTSLHLSPTLHCYHVPTYPHIAASVTTGPLLPRTRTSLHLSPPLHYHHVPTYPHIASCIPCTGVSTAAYIMRCSAACIRRCWPTLAFVMRSAACIRRGVGQRWPAWHACVRCSHNNNYLLPYTRSAHPFAAFANYFDFKK